MEECKKRRGKWLKAIAIAVICFFTLNNLVWANPQIFQRNTFSPASQQNLSALVGSVEASLRLTVKSLVDAVGFNFFAEQERRLYPEGPNGLRVYLHSRPEAREGENLILSCNIGSKNYEVLVSPQNEILEVREKTEKAKPSPQQAQSPEKEKMERKIIALRSIKHGHRIFNVRGPLTGYSLAYGLLKSRIKTRSILRQLEQHSKKVTPIFTTVRDIEKKIEEISKRGGTLKPQEAEKYVSELREVFASLQVCRGELQNIFKRCVSASQSESDGSDWGFAIPVLRDIINAELIPAMERLQSRLEFIDAQPSSEKHSLNEIITGAVDVVEKYNYKEYITLGENLPDSVVFGSRLSLISAVTNIINNCSHFAEKNSGEDAKVKISITEEDGFARIDISDNGGGIPEDKGLLDTDPETDRKPLFKLNVSEREGGTGLGLAEVWYTVKDHGGTVDVKNEPGKGATFTIRLPVILLDAPVAETDTTDEGKPESPDMAKKERTSLKELLSRHEGFKGMLQKKETFFLSGIPDDAARALLEETIEVNRIDNPLVISFSELVNRLRKVDERAGLGYKYNAFFVYGYRPFKDGEYTTEDALRALRTLRKISQSITRPRPLKAGIVVTSANEFDITQFTDEQIDDRAFPLMNFPVFFHHTGGDIVEYNPRWEQDESLRFPATGASAPKPESPDMRRPERSEGVKPEEEEVLDTITYTKEDLIDRRDLRGRLERIMSQLKLNSATEIFNPSMVDISQKTGHLIYFPSRQRPENRNDLAAQVIGELFRNLEEHVRKKNPDHDFSLELQVIRRKSDSRKGIRIISKSEGQSFDTSSIFSGGLVRDGELAVSLGTGIQTAFIRGIFFLKISRIAKKHNGITFTVESGGKGIRFSRDSEESFEADVENNRITATIFETPTDEPKPESPDISRPMRENTPPASDKLRRRALKSLAEVTKKQDFAQSEHTRSILQHLTWDDLEWIPEKLFLDLTVTIFARQDLRVDFSSSITEIVMFGFYNEFINNLPAERKAELENIGKKVIAHELSRLMVGVSDFWWHLRFGKSSLYKNVTPEESERIISDFAEAYASYYFTHPDENVMQGSVALSEIEDVGTDILDVGSGVVGFEHIKNWSNPRQLILMDENPFVIQTLRSFLKLTGKRTVDVVDADFLNYDPKRPVPYIRANHVLHHVRERGEGRMPEKQARARQLFLGKAFSILENGGTLCVSDRTDEFRHLFERSGDQSDVIDVIRSEIEKEGFSAPIDVAEYRLKGGGLRFELTAKKPTTGADTTDDRRPTTDEDNPDGFINKGPMSKAKFEESLELLRWDVNLHTNTDFLVQIADAIIISPLLTPKQRGTIASIRKKIKNGKYKIYAFTSIIEDFEDYFLGKHYKKEGEIFLASDLVDALGKIDSANDGKTSLVGEYALHELLCPIVGHYEAIRIQKAIFPQNYPDEERLAEDPSYKGLLREALRKFIDRRAGQETDGAHKTPEQITEEIQELIRTAKNNVDFSLITVLALDYSRASKAHAAVILEAIQELMRSDDLVIAQNAKKAMEALKRGLKGATSGPASLPEDIKEQVDDPDTIIYFIDKDGMKLIKGDPTFAVSFRAKLELESLVTARPIYVCLLRGENPRHAYKGTYDGDQGSHKAVCLSQDDFVGIPLDLFDVCFVTNLKIAMFLKKPSPEKDPLVIEHTDISMEGVEKILSEYFKNAEEDFWQIKEDSHFYAKLTDEEMEKAAGREMEKGEVLLINKEKDKEFIMHGNMDKELLNTYGDALLILASRAINSLSLVVGGEFISSSLEGFKIVLVDKAERLSVPGKDGKQIFVNGSLFEALYKEDQDIAFTLLSASILDSFIHLMSSEKGGLPVTAAPYEASNHIKEFLFNYLNTDINYKKLKAIIGKHFKPNEAFNRNLHITPELRKRIDVAVKKLNEVISALPKINARKRLPPSEVEELAVEMRSLYENIEQCIILLVRDLQVDTALEIVDMIVERCQSLRSIKPRQIDINMTMNAIKDFVCRQFGTVLSVSKGNRKFLHMISEKLIPFTAKSAHIEAARSLLVQTLSILRGAGSRPLSLLSKSADDIKTYEIVKGAMRKLKGVSAFRNSRQYRGLLEAMLQITGMALYYIDEARQVLWEGEAFETPPEATHFEREFHGLYLSVYELALNMASEVDMKKRSSELAAELEESISRVAESAPVHTRILFSSLQARAYHMAGDMEKCFDILEDVIRTSLTEGKEYVGDEFLGTLFLELLMTYESLESKPEERLKKFIDDYSEFFGDNPDVKTLFEAFLSGDFTEVVETYRKKVHITYDLFDFVGSTLYYIYALFLSGDEKALKEALLSLFRIDGGEASYEIMELAVREAVVMFSSMPKNAREKAGEVLTNALINGELNERERKLVIMFLVSVRDKTFYEYLKSILPRVLQNEKVNGFTAKDLIDKDGLLRYFFSVDLYKYVSTLNEITVKPASTSRMMKDFTERLTDFAQNDPGVFVPNLEESFNDGAYADVVSAADKFLEEKGGSVPEQYRIKCALLRDKASEIIRVLDEAKPQYLRHDYAAALQRLEEALNLNPNDLNLHGVRDSVSSLARAEEAYRNGETDKALELAKGVKPLSWDKKPPAGKKKKGKKKNKAKKGSIPEEFLAKVEAFVDAKKQFENNPDAALNTLTGRILSAFPEDQPARTLHNSVVSRIEERDRLLVSARASLERKDFPAAKDLSLQALEMGKDVKSTLSTVMSTLESIYKAKAYAIALQMAESLIVIYPDNSDFQKMKNDCWANILLERLRPQYNILTAKLEAMKHRQKREKQKYGKGAKNYYSSIEFSPDGFTIKGLGKQTSKYGRTQMTPMDNAHEIVQEGDSCYFTPREGEWKDVAANLRRNARDMLTRARNAEEINAAKRLLEESEKLQVSPDYFTVERVDDTSVTFAFDSLEQRAWAQLCIPKSGIFHRMEDVSLVRQKEAVEDSIKRLENYLSRGGYFTAGNAFLDILFGLNVTEAGEEKKDRKISFPLLEEGINSDDSQRNALLAGIDLLQDKVTLIQGPPGTGKTTVIADIVNQLIQNGEKVLVVSQSHPAIDNVGEVFKRSGIQFARAGARGEKVSDDLLEEWTNRYEILRKFKKEYQRSGKGFVVLGTNNGYLNDGTIRKDPFFQEFDVVIIEEAGRATIPETMVPIAMAKRKTILVGDHKQLPAFGVSEDDKKMVRYEIQKGLNLESRGLPFFDGIFSSQNVTGFKISLFQKAVDLERERKIALPWHMLRVNRRSPPVIVGLVNIFYDGKLLPRDHDKEEKEVPEEDTLRLVDVKGKGIRVNSSTSFLNLTEVDKTLSELCRVLEQKNSDGAFRYNPEDVTIISPYLDQNSMILMALKAKAIIDKIMNSHEEVKLSDEEKSILRKSLREDVRFDGKTKRFVDGFIRRPYSRSVDGFVKLMKFQIPLRTQRRLSPEEVDSVNVMVNTIDSIQGHENKVVIVSMVQSNDQGRVGFLGTFDGLQRINVALSRAKEKMVIIGDFEQTLTRARDAGARKIFKRISEYVRKNGQYIQASGPRGSPRGPKEGPSGATRRGAPAVFAITTGEAIPIVGYICLGILVLYEIGRILYNAGAFNWLTFRFPRINKILHFMYGMNPRDRKIAEILLRNAPIPFHILDHEGTIIRANPMWLRTMGLGEDEEDSVTGKSIFEFIDREQRKNARERFEARIKIWKIRKEMSKLDSASKRYNELLKESRNTLMPRKVGADRIYLKRGEHAGERIIARTDDTITEDMVITSFQDITELRKNIAKLQQMQDEKEEISRRDPGTGLYNIRHFKAEINDFIMKTAEKGSEASVLAISLDSFDEVKGKPEEFAVTMGERIQECLDEVEGEHLHTLTYLGNGVYGVLVRGSGGPAIEEKIKSIVNRLPRKLKQIVTCGGRDFALHGTISTGAAIYPRHSDDADNLIYWARAALKEAQTKEGNALVFCDAELKLKDMQHLKLVDRLQEALYDPGENGFSLAFQPQVNLETNEIEGVEALIRWDDLRLGKVFPDQFIPMAEDREWVGCITGWVLREACEQAYAWQKKGYNIKISVNISPKDLYRAEPTVVTTLKEALEQIKESEAEAQGKAISEVHGLDPGRIALEITESSVVKDKDRAIFIINQLQEMGVEVHIDDFGIKEAALIHLSELPCNVIKLDRDFIMHIFRKPGKSTPRHINMVKGIINMAHGMGVKVIAEGVETREQLELLRESGCDYAQGYFKGNGLGRPAPASEVEKALEKEKNPPEEGSWLVENISDEVENEIYALRERLSKARARFGHTNEDTELAFNVFFDETLPNALYAKPGMIFTERHGDFDKFAEREDISKEDKQRFVQAAIDEGRPLTKVRIEWYIDEEKITLKIGNNSEPTEYHAFRIKESFNLTPENFFSKAKVTARINAMLGRFSGMGRGIFMIRRAAEVAGGILSYRVEDGWTAFEVILPKKNVPSDEALSEPPAESKPNETEQGVKVAESEETPPPLGTHEMMGQAQAASPEPGEETESQEDAAKPQTIWRDVTDTEKMLLSLIEEMLSLGFNKEVVLAFEENIGAGQEVNPLDGVLAALAHLRQNPRYEKILKKLKIITASPEDMRSKIESDTGKDAEVFVFSRYRHHEKLAGLELDERIHAVYIDENIGEGREFGKRAYYPLAEIVVISIAQALAPIIAKNERTMVLQVPGIDDMVLHKINIKSVLMEENNTLLFTLLPDAKEMNKSELMQKYATLKRFLKAA